MGIIRKYLDCKCENEKTKCYIDITFTNNDLILNTFVSSPYCQNIEVEEKKLEQELEQYSTMTDLTRYLMRTKKLGIRI